MNEYQRPAPGRQDAGAHLPAQGPAGRRRGRVDTNPQFVECKQCGRRATRQIWAKSALRLPQLRRPPAHRRLLPPQPCAGPGQLPGAGRRRLPPQDVLQFPGLPGKAGRRRPAKTGLKRSCRHRRGAHRAARPVRGRGAGQPVLYGQHEHRCGRKDHPRRGARHQQSTCRWSSSRPAAVPGCRRAFSA